MAKHWQQPAAVAAVLLFGFTLFWFGTDGFRAFTVETARLAELKNSRPAFPDVVLEDSEGKTYPIAELGGSYLFLTFFYTSCYTVCPELEMNMAGVYELIPERYIGKDITFLSVSFDPARDDVDVLHRYKDYFGSDGVSWRMARVPDEDQLKRLLDAFGVTVIPDGNGHYTHNVAFYLAGPDGRLIDVMDYKKIEAAAKRVVTVLERGDRA